MPEKAPQKSCSDVTPFEELGVLSSKLIHDLSNDLTCLVSGTELLRDDLIAVGGDAQENGEYLMSAVERMGKNLQDFVNLRRQITADYTSLCSCYLAPYLDDSLPDNWSLQGEIDSTLEIKGDCRWIAYATSQLSALADGQAGTCTICEGTKDSLQMQAPRWLIHRAQDYLVVTFESEAFRGLQIDFDDLGASTPGLLACQHFLRQMRGWADSYQNDSGVTSLRICLPKA